MFDIRIGGQPRRRRRRRPALLGAGLVAAIVAALFAQSRMNRKPAADALPARIPAAGRILDAARLAFPQPALQQIPATVIDNGRLRNVPYVSWRSGDLEVNIYGDPEAPCAVEAGVTGALLQDEAAKARCAALLAGLLPDAEDAKALGTLGGRPGRTSRTGLAFEITPETAPDAYGGWWVTVLDERRLEGSRASAAELGELSSPKSKPADWSHDEIPKSRPSSTAVYSKAFRKLKSAYVRLR